MGLTISKKLLFGRLLAKSGDQAWDFALPLVLLFLFPGELRIAATYYFIIRLLHTFLLPKVASYIDQWDRWRAIRFGIILQLIGVLLGAVSIFFVAQINRDAISLIDPKILLISGLFTLGGLLSSLGSAFMDIAVANDLVPSSIPESEMSAFNSRFRQVDLFTEVTAPFLAGFVLLIDRENLTGFYILAIWNLISFFPELGLLNSIFKDRPDLKEKTIQVGSQLKVSIFKKFSQGWSVFFREKIALVSLAYAFLWLSVLSPHGVLLAAFLKDGWQLPEWGIGIFRGAGALFGLAATVLFPRVIQKYGLEKGSQKFIFFQSGTLILGLIAFMLSESLWAQIAFLGLILFSRVGLYGFSLGEMQIRQLEIKPEVRGQVNGFASALTGFATLILYGLGALLPETSDLRILVAGSVGFVCLAAVIYHIWFNKYSHRA